MEENNVKVKSKAKITVVVLIAFLLLCAAVGSAFLLMQKKNNVDNGEVVIKYEEKETAADEATLRKLLAHESDMIIEVTEDIMISQPITVKGGKRLTGDGTISMALYVEPYQYMLVVDKDSNLELDGVTIDGNGSSNCVKVEKNAQCSLMSGKLTYGCPTVIESFGDVYIKGGAIVDAVGTGVYVHSTGKVYMTAGSVSGCIDCGIEGAVDSYISVSEKAVLHDNMEYFIYSKGTCDITGGDFRDAQSDMVYTSGVMNVKYEGDEKDGMLKWHDIKGCAFIVGNGGELNVEKLHVTDVENRIVSTSAGKNVANISNCLFENIGGAAVYVRADANLKNVDIKNAGYGSKSAGTGGNSGIMVIETGKVNIDNVTITGTVKDGIQNGGGIVTGKNLVVNSAGRIGINSYKLNDVEGSVKLDNVTINGAKSNGLHVEASTLTVTNAKIKDVGGEGARAQKAGKLNITNIEIKNAKGRNITSYDAGSKVVVKNAKTVGGQRGIGAFGGNVTATKVSIDSPTEYGVTASKKSNVNVTDVTIKNSAKTAVNANDAVITMDKAIIENQKEEAGLNADYSGKITLKDADIKFAKGIEGDIDGVRAVGPATITLENVDVVNAPRSAVYSNGAQAKITVKNVTATGGKRGIQIFKGGQIEGETISITSPTEYGVTCGDKGSIFTLTNLTVTDCGKHAVNVYDSAVAEVTGGTFTKTADLGVYVGNKGKLTLNDVAVSNTKNSGMMNENATLVVKIGSIKGAGGHGVYTSKGGQTTLKNFTTTDGKRGIQVFTGGKVTGEVVTILSPTEHGVACGGEGSCVDITNLTVSRKGDSGASSGEHAINVYEGAIAKVTKGTLVSPGVNGVNVDKGAQLTLDNVKVEKAGAHAVYTEKATLVLKGTIEIIEPKNRGLVNYGGIVDAKDAIVNVNNPGEFGVATNVSTKKVKVDEVETTVETPGTTTIGELNISSAGEEKKAYSSMTVNGVGTVVTVYKGEITDSWKHGINVEKGTLNLSNFKINNSGQEKADNGEYDGVQAQAASTINLSGVEVTGGSNGVNISKSGNVTGSDTVTIKSPAMHGVKCKGGNFTLVDLKVTNSGSHGVNLEDSASGTMTGGKIEDSGKNGIYLYDKNSSLNVGNMEITGCGAKGIEVNKFATATLSGTVQIKNSNKENLYLHNTSTVNVDGTLNMTGGNTYSLAVYGESTVNGDTNNSKITIATPKSFGVFIADAGSLLKVNNMELTNCQNHGIFIKDKGQAEFNGSVSIQGANSGDYDCLYVTGASSQATVNGTLTTTGGRYGLGIFSGGKVIKGENYSKIEINSSRKHGAVVMNNSELNVGAMTLNTCGGNGIHMQYDKPTVKLTGQVDMSNINGNGVDVYHGDLKAESATINVTTAQYGLRARGSSVTNIAILNINGAKGHSAVRAQDTAKVTINGGTIQNSNQYGVNVLGNAILTMSKVIITNSKNADLIWQGNSSKLNLSSDVTYTSSGKLSDDGTTLDNAAKPNGTI